jgi:hypothetical protein
LRWLRILLIGTLAIVGGVLGNLLVARIEGSWGQMLTLWRLLGSIAGVGLVLVLAAGVGRVFDRSIAGSNRAELLRQAESYRRELRRLRRSYESGLPWTSARTVQVTAFTQRLEEIVDRLGRGPEGVPDDAIDSYFVPQLSFPSRAKAFLGRRSGILLVFPIFVILSLCLSPVLERFYRGSLAGPAPVPTPAAISALASIPTATGTPTIEPQTPTLASTSTPSPVPTVTSTPTNTPTWTPAPTDTPTQAATSTPAPTDTPTQAATSTPTPTWTPAPTRTRTQTAMPTNTATQVAALASEPETPAVLPQVPNVRPAIASTLAPFPAPILIEPESGAAFPDQVRFKFSWVRMPATSERFSIYLESVDDPATFEWRPKVQDILGGGGDIYPIAEGYRFEVNGGIGTLPPGKALWRVAVFSEDAGEMTQITSWSEERSIIRK